MGKLRDGWVYELFLTSQAVSSLPAATVLELYQQRGSFEQVLSDEDAEQAPDRWCSHRPYGQELWQLICQWVWNSRLSLGSVSSGAELRWTTWGSARAAPEAETGSSAEAPQTGEGTDQLAAVTPATTVTNRPSEAAESHPGH